tara:strand:+ start:8922 stop:10010 length:1089 start_codon:yes stop_codon:yes gene_type:complete
LILTYFTYLTTLFSSFFISYSNKELRKNKEPINSYKLISLIPIILIASFKGNTVGTDSENYYEYYFFLDTVNYSLIEILIKYIVWNEPLFFTINWIFKSLDFSYTFYSLFINILIWGLIYHSSKYITDRFYNIIFCSITLGFLFFSFNGIRQAIAISIIFMSIKFLIENKISKTIIIILIASLFHYSAIIFLPIYMIGSKIHISKNLLIIFTLIFLLIPNIFLINYLQNILSFLPKYSYYLNEIVGDRSITLGVVLNAFMMFFPILYHDSLYNNSKKNKLLFNMAYIGLFCYLLFYNNAFINRFIIYFFFFLIFVYARIFEYLSVSNKKNDQILIYSMLTILFLTKIITQDSGCCPYQFLGN